MLDNPAPEDYPGHEIDVDHEHDDEVKLVQRPLGVNVDGQFGAKTLASLQTYEKAHGLAVTNAVDKTTWDEMFGAADRVSPPYSGRPVVKDDKGDDVKLVQAEVDATVDGTFGTKTEALVKTWQGANGCAADGRVGRNTWTAMFP